MLCKCHWIVLYSVHVTAFCLRRPFFPVTVYFHFPHFCFHYAFVEHDDITGANWRHLPLWFYVEFYITVFISLSGRCQLSECRMWAEVSLWKVAGDWRRRRSYWTHFARNLSQNERKKYDRFYWFILFYSYSYSYFIKTHNKLARIKQSKT